MPCNLTAALVLLGYSGRIVQWLSVRLAYGEVGGSIPGPGRELPRKNIGWVKRREKDEIQKI